MLSDNVQIFKQGKRDLVGLGYICLQLFTFLSHRHENKFLNKIGHLQQRVSSRDNCQHLLIDIILELFPIVGTSDRDYHRLYLAECVCSAHWRDIR